MLLHGTSRQIQVEEFNKYTGLSNEELRERFDVTKVDLSQIETVIFDLDGCLYFETAQGNHVLTEGAAELIGCLHEQGIEVRYLTNNSGSSREQIIEKLQNLGLPNVQPEQVYGSAYLTAKYLSDIKNGTLDPEGEQGPALKAHLMSESPVFVYGSEGLAEELKSQGISNVYRYDLDTDQDELISQSRILVSGINKDINGPAIDAACQILAPDNNSVWVATNMDPRLPKKRKDGTIYHAAGNGALVAPIVEATKREPDLIIGKPAQRSFKYVANSAGSTDLSRVMMVGDNWTTDHLVDGMVKTFVENGVDELDTFAEHHSKLGTDIDVVVQNPAGLLAGFMYWRAKQSV